MAERQALGIDTDVFAGVGGTNYELYRQHIQDGVVDFLIIQAGKGTTRSRVFNEQSQNSEQLGIPFVTYHFLLPKLDPRRQAQAYIDWVGTNDPTYIVDIEEPAEGVSPPSRDQILRYTDALMSLTGKLPVLYSRVNILETIGFVDEARQFKLWIAQYLNDVSLQPQKDLPYKYFHDFTRDFGGMLPPAVKKPALGDNVILWQFSKKGDGFHYISNRMTDEGKIGVREVDLNISMGERDAFLQEIFGTIPPVDRARASGPLRQPVEPTYPDLDNQDMINIFTEAAQLFGLDPMRDWIVPAKLEHIRVPLVNRSKPYTGPKIEDLPGLKPEHKQAILVLIHPQSNRSRHDDRPYPGKTNQDIVNLIFRAALSFTDKPWENWIVPAGLESLALPHENRGKPYTGPRIEHLPNLAAEQKNAILALL